MGALTKEEEEEVQGATIPLKSLVKKDRIVGNGVLVDGTLFGDVVDGHRAGLT